ncbi:WAT1-related protein At1g09380-like [Camellia sinensis]|uniref:WAT1-related protein At1g09380-like n=1 Tax=Camellia sinensis TaxID=4442 RepID=UPI0010358B03|nr:WAT1-related protein At1g09380-like [Camellia sinensis]
MDFELCYIMMMMFGRLESVGMKRKAGQAKILGAVVCVGGAMLLSFYHGHGVIGESSIHWKYADDMGKENSTNHHHSNSFILGPFLIIASTVSWAIWFIIQARMSEKYTASCTISALICIMASIECGIIGLCADRNISARSLSLPGIRLFSSLYAGTVCTAAAFCLMSWCIQRKGPLYVSVFSPLLLIIVAILSLALLEEKLYVGTVVGSGLIVMGLYAVLWGKNGEMNVKSNAESLNPEEEEEKQEVTKSDLEIHFFGHSNGNFRTVRI